MTFRTITGDTSWSKDAIRSKTVREYQKDNKTLLRPPAEFEKAGDHIRILTGANVTRKRRLTPRGVASAIMQGSATVVCTFSKTGRKRRRRNAELNAGQKFDAGINKLVEDLAKNEDMWAKTSGRTEFGKRMDALYEQAEILKANGGFNDADIAERFRVNLMESLQMLQHEVKPADYLRVLNDLKQKILPRLEQYVGSPAIDKKKAEKIAENDKEQKIAGAMKEIDTVMTGLAKAGLGRNDFRKKLAFHRSVVVAGLRDVATFGSDIKKFDDFGGSHLLHDLYRGDAGLMQDFKGDHAGAWAFDLDIKAYKQWGGCKALHRSFRGKLGKLKGQDGGRALRDWIKLEYPARKTNTGNVFLKKHREYRQGVNDPGALSRLGVALQEEFEIYWGQDHNGLDFTVDNVINGPGEDLKNDFKDFVSNAKSGQAAGMLPTLGWLRELRDVRQYVNDVHKDSLDKRGLRNDIKKLARNAYSQGPGPNEVKDDIGDAFQQKYVSEAAETSDLNLDGNDKTSFQRAIAKAAGKEFVPRKQTLADSLKQLDGLNKDQLIKVLNEGFTAAEKTLSGTLTGAVTEFENIAVARRKNGYQNTFFMGCIKNAYGGDDRDRGSIDSLYSDDQRLGSEMAVWRLKSKNDDTPTDGRDLRIKEKELYELGYVYKAPKVQEHDIKVDAGPELIFDPPERNKENEKIDLDDRSDFSEDEADSVTRQLTGGWDLNTVRKELNKLPLTAAWDLREQRERLLRALDKVDRDGTVSDEADNIVSLATTIRDAERLKGQYHDIRTMLHTLALNAQKAADEARMDGGIKTDQ